jgi:maleylacetoacetate isomerase
MRLHGYFRSSAAYRVRIALNLKGIAYEDAPHHLRRNEQRSPGYLSLNPQGLVPVLETEGGDALIQSLAIIEYLDETYPQPALLPKGAIDRARVRGLAQVCAIDIHPINNLRVLRYLRTGMGQDEAAVGGWYRHWVEVGFSALERMLAGDARTGAFCHGDEPGLADVCLIPQVFNGLSNDVDVSVFPTIARIYATANDHAAFVKAQPSSQPDAE